MDAQLIKKIEFSEKSILTVDWNSEGKLLAAGTDENAFLIDKDKAEVFHKLDYEFEAEVRTLEFSPDDAHLACGVEDGDVIIYDLQELKEVKNWNLRYWTNSVKYSPKGDILAVGGSDEKVTMYKVEEDYLPGFEIDLESIVWDVAWGPKGKLLAVACNDGSVTVFNMEEGVNEYEWEHQKLVNAISIENNGIITSGSADESIMSLDIESEEMIEINLEEAPNCIEWCDDVLAVTTNFKSTYLFDKDLEQIGEIQHESNGLSLTWKDKYTLAVSFQDGSLGWWDLSY